MSRVVSPQTIHFQLTIGKRIDCPTFGNGWSGETWYAHYTKLAETRKNCDEKALYKTSGEWFDILYKTKYMILDIDGWRNLPDIDFYWSKVPITHVEFEQRFDQCTIKSI